LAITVMTPTREQQQRSWEGGLAKGGVAGKATWPFVVASEYQWVHYVWMSMIMAAWHDTVEIRKGTSIREAPNDSWQRLAFWHFAPLWPTPQPQPPAETKETTPVDNNSINLPSPGQPISQGESFAGWKSWENLGAGELGAW